MTLSNEQIALVTEAIRLARSPGRGEYADFLGPSCVIGQLLAIRGVSSEDLSNCINYVSSICRTDPEYAVEAGIPRSIILALRKLDMPVDMLQELQNVWDADLPNNPGFEPTVAEEQAITETRRCELMKVVSQYSHPELEPL